ncbi:LysE family translocator [Shewanella sp. C32]|uniref:LysE family translocator n=1 Tax=Shewanella electrica TaxID=515560 RepID=A0ABT2FJH8_9GAMM|nr:LysE family translocator [Shewanella electrica]MCH1923907.1 LysE family translocator [Shewanella electrica]MCS4555810.1 LysE family translocator [Shewanella electrica]
MSFSMWLGLLAICALGAVSPGPSLAMVVRHTLGGGRSHGILCAWAHSIGIGIYALITLLGLAALLKHYPLVFNAIAVAGGLYLAWLGWKALTARGGMQQKLAAGAPVSMWAAARDGLAISLLNPKIMLFFMALFSQFVLAAQHSGGKSLIVLTPVIVDGLWYTIIAFMLSQPKVLDKLRAKAQLIDRITGVVLMLLAVRVVVSLF